MLFPTTASANRCVQFIRRQCPNEGMTRIHILDFVPRSDKLDSSLNLAHPNVSAVIYPKAMWPAAKSFWQHTGEGISSRRGDFCHRAFLNDTMAESGSVSNSGSWRSKGPRRYQRTSSVRQTGSNGTSAMDPGQSPLDGSGERDTAQFVEERFGRNLNVAFARQAKLAIRKRIAGSMTNDAELPTSLEEPSDPGRQRAHNVLGFSVEDVYLYPTGMNAIFHAHLTLRFCVREEKSIMYGFPYVDTLKILEKFGAGAVFYGHGSKDELDDLERRLESGERFLSLFCEVPGNPLLRTPDIKRIRSLAHRYDFAVVIDETIGNFLNINVLPYADVLVSSLTKIFSGDSNVMGGSMVLNPNGKYYERMKAYLAESYEDTQFEEDSVYLERNSRDFIHRNQRVNRNAEVVVDVLQSHPSIKQVNYPRLGETAHLYDVCRLPEGGYGGLLSATFHRLEDAQIFYDNLDTQKGPSLGTNFTLSSPFVLLAHYGELDWAAQYGCELSLVRFSVGLEDSEKLRKSFQRALEAIEARSSDSVVGRSS